MSPSDLTLEFPHPAHTPDLPPMLGDLTWAETFNPSPQPPIMTLGLTGTLLHHPQLVSLPRSSGITSPFPTAPISAGTSPYRTRSSHLSLYQPSRNPLPAPQPTFTLHAAAVGETSGPHTDPRTAPLKQVLGNSSPSDSDSSHNLKDHHEESGQASRVSQQLRSSHHTPLPPSP